ncbi:MAG: metal-dependent transcriptional regulator [Acidobacteria bacterium]|nr:metal-dependent transcriptional regulator [Acidobacteriota bacterium]
MTDPLTSLIVVFGGLALLFVLFWPSTGLAWRWRRGLAASDRVEVEDALKHLWDGEYRQRPATLESLAGALGLSGRAAADLVDRLGRLDLLILDDAALHLTPEGRREALRVIRIHRLWERYLADETGLDAREWHAHAERREHGTSPQQAEAMAATLGYPRFDPHGDPIPMPSGEVPPHQGMPLTQLTSEMAAEIVHIEDEPEAVFAQIVALGLVPGMRVRLLDRSPHRLRIQADTEEVVLAPVVAANITVLPMDQAVEPAEMTRLSVLTTGESAEVVALAVSCRGAQRRRLLDLGVVPGTRITNELRGPSGDPTAYRIRGALIALRQEQASQIYVQKRQGASA